MTLGTGPLGREFGDTEGLTYVGGGKFVMAEERDRQAVLFTYARERPSPGAAYRPSTSARRSPTPASKASPPTRRPAASSPSRKQPLGIFQTGIDFDAGTATNGSPTTENPVNLFDPALAGLLDLADVFALSNLSTLNGYADSGHLLVLSQESGKIINVDRSGNDLQLTDDRLRPRQPARRRRPAARRPHDGRQRLPLRRERERRRGHGPPATLGLRALHRPEPGADRARPEQPDQLHRREHGTATRVKIADVVVTDDGLGTNRSPSPAPTRPSSK